MSHFPRKITINKDGVFIDEVAVTGVVSAEIKNINPGDTGSIKVALIFAVSEIDVQYCLFGDRDVKDS